MEADQDREFEPLPPELERTATIVVDAVFTVHARLGPGLLESIYKLCLEHELRKRGVFVEREVRVPIIYDDLTIEAGLQVDLLVERSIIIEAKSVEKVIPVHVAQLLTYLKFTKLRLGFLVNFNVPVIRQGIKRIIR